jgi:DNA-binding NtrC family response regulator
VILVVDDDPYVRESLRAVLEFEGYAVLEAADGKAALDILPQHPIELVLLDLELPRVSGMEVLRHVAASDRGIGAVIVSGRGSIRSAVDATRLGALDFVEKPVDAQQLLVIVRAALEQTAGRRHRKEVAARYRLIGGSSAMQNVYALIDRAASVSAKVLITGESGTGKELTARAIHMHSRQARGPMVTVNCAAIPESLIENELFGHERGAFTGAAAMYRGRFEQAQDGTLFLDEIGDMSLFTQPRRERWWALFPPAAPIVAWRAGRRVSPIVWAIVWIAYGVLRALEERAIQRVGGAAQVAVRFRLIAATHRDLRVEIERGNFRNDLFYRLNVIRIELPPLRARREDIAPLAEHLLRLACSLNDVPGKRLAAPALGVLTAYDWPGNVRELQNALERIVVLTEGDTINANDVGRALESSPTHGPTQPSTGLREARDAFERAYIQATIRQHAGRIQESADALGINRSHLWRKLRALDIEPDLLTSAQPDGED